MAQGKFFSSPQIAEMVVQGYVGTSKEQSRPARGQSEPTQRESEIIRLLAMGKSNKEISSALGISIRTVETHRAKIMLKLGLHSVTQLVYYALPEGLVAATDMKS